MYSLHLYRQRSGFAPQYFVLVSPTTSSRVYTRVKRLGEAQTFSEAVYWWIFSLNRHMVVNSSELSYLDHATEIELFKSKNRILIKEHMEYIFERITIDDELCGGKPTIRGLRITAQTILEFLFNGTPESEVLEQFPVLEKEDIEACKKFALEMMNKNFRIKDLAA